MSESVLVACLQLNSQDNEDDNWNQIQSLASRAASYNAKVLALPENMLYEGGDFFHQHKVQEVWLPRLKELAKSLKVSIVAGSMREPTEQADDPLAYNSSIAINAEGEEVGRYHKVHLFDIDLPNGPTHKESDYLKPGSEAVSCDLDPLGRVGLTICYDLRFPELYRKLAYEHECKVFFVPASFTMDTGRDHWVSLLRARAIENQCFVVAPDQWGWKGKRMRKYGRSVIIDPWGTVMACAPDGVSLCLAEVDLARADDFRKSLPCRQHARLLPKKPL